LKSAGFFIVFICLSALYADHIDVEVNGVYQGNFRAPAEILFGTMYLNDFEYAVDSDSLEITLFPTFSHPLDTLQLFFSMENIWLSSDSVCSVSSNADSITVEFGSSLLWPEWEPRSGYNVSIPQSSLIDSLFIKFKICNYSWSADNLALLCKTNMVHGYSDWVPLAVGNIWQYEFLIAESPHAYEHQNYRRFHIVDSLITTDSLTRYLIEAIRFADGTQYTNCCDTVHIDESNELVWSGNISSMSQEIFPYDLSMIWLREHQIYKIPGSDSLAYYLYWSLNFAGGEAYSRYRYGVGLIESWDVTWPWDEWLTILRGARIGGVDMGWYTPLGVNEEKAPQDFSLNVRAYPNPFNAGIRFEFDLLEPGLFQYSIYDIKGGTIYREEAENQSTGTKSYYWDGTDSYGEKVSTGIYFMELKSETVRQVIKIALIK